jgi:hypothetical protein
MDSPAPLHLAVNPSRVARAWVALLAICTGMLMFTLPIALWIAVPASVCVALWGQRNARSLANGGGSLRWLRVEGDRMLSVRLADGQALRGRILSSSYVGPRLTTLVWRPQGARRARAHVLLPDMMAQDDFRQLRVLLRHGRNEAVQGAPLSHA